MRGSKHVEACVVHPLIPSPSHKQSGSDNCVNLERNQLRHSNVNATRLLPAIHLEIGQYVYSIHTSNYNSCALRIAYHCRRLFTLRFNWSAYLWGSFELLCLRIYEYENEHIETRNISAHLFVALIETLLCLYLF